MARRRRWLHAALTAALVVGLGVAAYLWFEVRQAPGTWERVDAPPIRPATGALVAWSGEEVVVLGGDLDAPCFGGMRARSFEEPVGSPDAAAYDPATGEWRLLPALPQPMHDGDAHVVADGVLYVATAADRVYRLDLDADEWELGDPYWTPPLREEPAEVPTLPDDAPAEGTSVSWADDRAYAFGGADAGSDEPVLTNAFWRYRPE